ncbi:MAG: hypothetical protein GX595_17895 [Lentisphaerae bacterium]|nr:hypothetical protein [Lentisphaerota bacterium]
MKHHRRRQNPPAGAAMIRPAVPRRPRPWALRLPRLARAVVEALAAVVPPV